MRASSFLATTLTLALSWTAAGSGSQSAATPRAVVLRTNPRISDVRLEVELFQQASTLGRNPTVTVNGTTSQRVDVSTTPVYTASGVTLGIPVLVRTSWCDTDFTKATARALVDGVDTNPDLSKIFVRSAGSAEALLKYEVPFSRGVANNVLIRTTYQTQRWEVQVDERAAGTSTWPRAWPSGTERFVKAEPGINPALPAIKTMAEGATRGGFRSVSPYLAAKNAVLAITKAWRSGNTATSIYGQKGALRGINFTADGTAWGLEAGGGTPVELAATCVAGVRALGIPSRVVYCLTERSRRKSNDKGTSVEFRFVCEFFLPDIGWIPFDPMIIRENLASNPTTDAVKGFAQVPDLQDAIPLAYRTLPEGYAQADRYALWGWNGSVIVEADRAVTRIGFEDSSRGNGTTPQMPAPVSDEAP